MGGLEIASLVVKGLGFISKLDRDVKWAKRHDKDSFMDIVGIVARDASQSGVLNTLSRIESADALAASKASAAQLQALQMQNLMLDLEIKRANVERLKGIPGCDNSGCGK